MLRRYRLRLAEAMRDLAFQSDMVPHRVRGFATRAHRKVGATLRAWSGVVSGCRCTGNDPESCAGYGEWCECMCHQDNVNRAREADAV